MVNQLLPPFLLFLLLTVAKAVSETREIPSCRVTFQPTLLRPTQLPQTYSKSPQNLTNSPLQPVLQSGDLMRYLINCSCCSNTNYSVFEDHFGQPGGLFFRIFASNRYSTIISRQSLVDPVIRSRFESAGDMSNKYEECRHAPLCAVIYSHLDANSSTATFWVEANLLGRSSLHVDLVWVNATATDKPTDIPLPSALSEKDIRKQRADKEAQQSWQTRNKLNHQQRERFKRFTFHLVARGKVVGEEEQSRVTVYLKPQLFYTIFDWSVLFVAATISLSAGCNTDPKSLVRQVKRRPVAVTVGLIVHLFVTPLIGLVAGYASCLSQDKTYGLFVTTTLQVGCPALVVISLSDCHEQFALAMAFLANILNLVTAPLWVFAVGTYVFEQPILLGRFCGLLGLVSMVQILGFLLRYVYPNAANALVTWFSRPSLLLAGILFVTLGVYINQYVFQAPQTIAYLQHVSVALVVMLTMSYVCGWLAGLIVNLSVRRSRALANQISVYQGLLAIPLLRICVPSPEGELASAAALWTVFLTPVPLVYNAMLKLLIQTIKSAIEAHKVRRRKRGPTAMLCADSLAAVAFTSMLLPPEPKQIPTKHKSTNTSENGPLAFDEASNSSTVNSAPAVSASAGFHKTGRHRSTAVRPTGGAFFPFKDSLNEVENRERVLEALARKSGANSEKRQRTSRTVHPRSLDDFGGPMSPQPSLPPPPSLPSSGKPLF